MKLPRFGLRTLFVLEAVLGMVFVTSAKWPVTKIRILNRSTEQKMADRYHVPPTPED